MTVLSNDIDTLKALVKELLEKIKRLEAEKAELRRRLGLDSTNSHNPPSRDGYQKKSLKPGIPKSGKRGIGGQKGHQGKTLKRVEHPEQIQLHHPEYCLYCGRPFSSNETYEIVHSRQLFDLPVSKLEVTEHRLAQIECCQRVQHGEYPKAVTATVQYGAGVRALVTKLSVDHKMPLKQISQLFEDLYGYELNSTTIEETLQRGYRFTAIKLRIPPFEKGGLGGI
jgi:transposase